MTRVPADADGEVERTPVQPGSGPRVPVGALVGLGILLLLGTHVLREWKPYTFLHGDGAFYATINRGLAQGVVDQRQLQPTSWYEGELGWNHDLEQDWSNVALGVDGTWWPKHPMVMPLTSTPVFALLGYPGLLLFNLAVTVGLLGFAWRLARRWAGPEAAGVAALLAAVTPLLQNTAYAYSNDAFYALLVLAGLDRWLDGRVGWSGVLLGLAIAAKPFNAIFAAPPGLALLVRRRWDEAARMAVGGALPVFAWLGFNWFRFGSPLATSYDRILVVEQGETALASARERFNQPLPSGMLELLTHERAGLWRKTPELLVAVGGLPWLLKRTPWHAVVLLVWIAAWALFYGAYDYRYARFFLPWAGLAVVPLAILLDRGARGPRWLLARLVPRIRAQPARWSAAAAAGLLLVVGVRAGSAVAGDAWRATDHVEEAEVTRQRHGSWIPCDYFNPKHHRWECARIDPGAWALWGRALDGGCTFDGRERSWLWLHVPDGSGAKRIRFDDVPPGPVELHHGLTDTSRASGVRLRLLDGAGELASLETGEPGEVETRTLPADARRGDALVLEVPEQPHRWRQLCASIRVPRSATSGSGASSSDAPSR